MAAALTALSTAVLLLFASPAKAASVQHFENANLRNGYMISCCSGGSTAASPVWLEQSADARWTVYSLPDVNGHGVVHMQSADEPAAGCLDSHGNGSGGSVWVQACNNGDYQKWEVFKVSSGGQTLLVFKNRGAFTQQGGKNLCIAGKHTDDGSIREGIYLTTCNTGSSWQQFF